MPHSQKAGANRKRKKRKANRGSFRPGYDPRRHVFTRAERRLGYLRCLTGYGKCSNPHVCAWVWRKVRSYYRSRNHGSEEKR